MRRKLTTHALILMLVASSLVMVGMPALGDDASRTGATGNEPASGFFEGNDTFAIYHSDGTNDTLFALDETVYVNITTDRVIDTSNSNQLRVEDYLGNNLYEDLNAFTQTDNAAPGYSYEASFDLDSGTFATDHYRLEVDLSDGNADFTTADVIRAGAGANPEKYIKTFVDDAFTTEGWAFNLDDTIYIEMYSNGENLRSRDCDIDLEDYQGNRRRRALNQLDNSTDTTVGNYVRMAYSLVNDAGAFQLNGGWWYTLEFTLDNTQGTNVLNDWIVQFYINDLPAAFDVQAFPATVDRVGTGTTAIFSEFSDLDATSVDDFTVTIEVREPDDQTTITLVDAQANGNGGLTVTDLGGGNYNASCDWDPPDTAALGLYDLQMTIIDNLGSGETSTFDDNADELEVVDSTINPPTLVAGITWVDPAVVVRAGTDSTTIYSNFSDTDDHNVVEYIVSFKVRDEANNEIILVDNKADGGTGELMGTVNVVRVAAGEYTASYNFNPPDNWALGFYDLYFNVTDPTLALAEDIYANNQDELELIAGTNAPQVVNVSAVPDTVDKMGTAVTDLIVNFTDADNHPVDDFNVTVAVRDPTGTPIDIALDVGNGGTGEFGGTMTIVRNLGNYTATIPWDPPTTVVVGLYDLRAEVRDASSSIGQVSFDDHRDKLNITTSDEPPALIAGDTMANPAVVPRLGAQVTTISCKFTDTNTNDPTAFNVTFKVRDAGNAETVLVDNKAHGGAGEPGGTVDVRLTGNHFTASYDWDPADDQALGLYDLFFSVTDGTGTATDGYANNIDELEITDAPTPLDLVTGNTWADPDTVNRNGAMTTTIYTNFTDPGVTAVDQFVITFRLRSPSGQQIDLAVDKRHGEMGEGGGLLTVVNTSAGFTASVTWNPPSDAELGTYDLFAHIFDGTYEVADGFGANLEELTVVDEPVATVMGIRASPTSIFVEGAESTTLIVNFTDPAEANISTFKVTIKVRSPTGTEMVLVSDKESGGAGEMGGSLKVNKVETNYTASIGWDPAVTVEVGMYDLFARVTNAAGWYDETGYDVNADELELKRAPVVGEPSLSGDSAKKDGKSYRFKVSYFNAKNIAPNALGVVLIIDDVRYMMYEMDGTDTNYTNGKDYYFLIELGDGKHTYFFEVMDETDQSASTVLRDLKAGEEEEEETNEGSVEALIAVFIMLLIVICLLVGVMAMTGKKDDKGPKEPPPEEAPVAKPVDEEAPEAKPVDEVKEAKVEPAEAKPAEDGPPPPPPAKPA